MVDIELVQSLLDKYQTLQDKDDDDYIGEISHLNILNEELKWTLLTDTQKQKTRKERHDKLLSKLYKDNDDTNFSYEGLVIALYDQIVAYETIIKPYSNQEDLLFRLYAILILEKNFIDKHRRICNIKHINQELVTNIFIKLEKKDVFVNLKLKHLWNKFDEMFKLLPKEPYRI